mmetsp:Transcript_86427/g.149551  ORF Transcript_86427/g.149551 Transcript_86427/m.149551 type:complete len:257 (-) Transcript_86427:910-1680(-)
MASSPSARSQTASQTCVAQTSIFPFRSATSPAGTAGASTARATICDTNLMRASSGTLRNAPTQPAQSAKQTAGLTIVDRKASALGATSSGLACAQRFAHCSAKGWTMSFTASSSAAAATRPVSPARARDCSSSAKGWAAPSAHKACPPATQHARMAAATARRGSPPPRPKRGSTRRRSSSAGRARGLGAASMTSQVEAMRGAKPLAAAICCNSVGQTSTAGAMSSRFSLAYLESTQRAASALSQSPPACRACSSSA